MIVERTHSVPLDSGRGVEKSECPGHNVIAHGDLVPPTPLVTHPGHPPAGQPLASVMLLAPGDQLISAVRQHCATTSAAALITWSWGERKVLRKVWFMAGREVVSGEGGRRTVLSPARSHTHTAPPLFDPDAYRQPSGHHFGQREVYHYRHWYWPWGNLISASRFVGVAIRHTPARRIRGVWRNYSRNCLPFRVS